MKEEGFVLTSRLSMVDAAGKNPRLTIRSGLHQSRDACFLVELFPSSYLWIADSVDRRSFKKSRIRLTPEFGLAAGRRIQIPSVAFGMIGQDYRIMAHFLRDKTHARVFEGLSEHGVTDVMISTAGRGSQRHTHKPFRPVRCLVLA